LGKNLKTINVKDVDEDAWNHFAAQAIIRKLKTGQLLSQVIGEWLAKEAT